MDGKRKDQVGPRLTSGELHVWMIRLSPKKWVSNSLLRERRFFFHTVHLMTSMPGNPLFFWGIWTTSSAIQHLIHCIQHHFCSLLAEKCQPWDMIPLAETHHLLAQHIMLAFGSFCGFFPQSHSLSMFVDTMNLSCKSCKSLIKWIWINVSSSLLPTLRC